MADEQQDFSRYVGKITSRGTVVVERGPVTNFATGVRDTNPVYRNAATARAEGFADIPAPPTFGFALQNWGKWEELQPEDPTPDGSPMFEIMGALMGNGGIVLHGEQEFRYHQPLVVGQRLHFEGVLRDVYQKPSGTATMTFVVTEDTYSDEQGDAVLTCIMNLIHKG